MSERTERLDEFKPQLEKALHFIWTHPETGYQEWAANDYLKKEFTSLGYSVVDAGEIPGFYTELDTGRPGPTLAVMGELDALNCENHAEAVNGKAHACGHCAQATALLGIAAVLSTPGALDGLSGRIRLLAVPAEELIETEYRESLRQKGIIHYFGGKPEFLRRGLLDGVDLAMMVHTATGLPPHTGRMNRGANGMISFTATFHGLASHAGGSPEKGINALYAANQALSAINAIRETFPDAAHIRVHPIMTQGGSSVNIIPDTVTLESYVRGAEMDEILATSKKVYRAIAGAAASIGAGVTIRTRPGYYVRKDDPNMMLTMKEAMEETLENVQYVPENWGTGCTDMGDISAVMPSLHAYMSGASGAGHGIDYKIASFDSAVMDSARAQLRFIELLLENGAARAKKIVEEHKPVFENKEAYFAYMDALVKDQDAVVFNEDGTITLQYN